MTASKSLRGSFLWDQEEKISWPGTTCASWWEAKTWEFILPSAAAAVTESSMSHEWDPAPALKLPTGEWRAALEVALRLWTSEGQNESNAKEECSARSACQELSERLQSLLVLGHGRDHWTHIPALLTWISLESYKMTAHCPHSLLGLHWWSGHGNTGVPATGNSIHRWEENVPFEIAAALNHLIT